VLIWSTLRKVSVQVMPMMPRDNTASANTANTAQAMVLASQTFRSLAPADTVATVTVTLTMPAPLSP
jgi:hypothetical protein